MTQMCSLWLVYFHSLQSQVDFHNFQEILCFPVSIFSFCYKDCSLCCLLSPHFTTCPLFSFTCFRKYIGLLDMNSPILTLISMTLPLSVSIFSFCPNAVVILSSEVILWFVLYILSSPTSLDALLCQSSSPIHFTLLSSICKHGHVSYLITK